MTTKEKIYGKRTVKDMRNEECEREVKSKTEKQMKVGKNETVK